jgi:hypothetical protein
VEKVLDVNTMGRMRVSEAFVDHVARSKAQAYYFWRLDRISQLKGCREHGHA